jgi:hypothetical protein
MGTGTVGYELILFAHVLAAIGLIGAGLIAAPMVHSHLQNAGSVTEIRRWLGIGRPPRADQSAVVDHVAGHRSHPGITGRWWAEPWVVVALAMWTINAGSATVMNRSMGRVAQLAVEAESDLIASDLAAARRSSGLTVVPDVLLAGDLGVLFLMVVKPTGWVAPILSILAAQVVILAGRRALGAIRPRVSGPVMG